MHSRVPSLPLQRAANLWGSSWKFIIPTQTHLFEVLMDSHVPASALNSVFPLSQHLPSSAETKALATELSTANFWAYKQQHGVNGHILHVIHSHFDHHLMRNEHEAFLAEMNLHQVEELCSAPEIYIQQDMLAVDLIPHCFAANIASNEDTLTHS